PARDRPDRRAGPGDQPARRRRRGAPRRPGDPSPAAARRGVPQLRGPPDGDLRRRDRARGARGGGGGHRHHGQDASGLPRAVVGGGGVRGGGRNLDEDDIRVRARGGSRPRTRIRPKHENARVGMVTTVDRGRYRCLVEGRQITAMKARELGRGRIVVGDRVALVGDLSGVPDTLARTVRGEERSSVLRRTAHDTDPVERVIVANADRLVIVCALADPDPQPRFIDRCLVAAYDAGLEPLLCLTKADLAGPGELLDAYAALDLRSVVTDHRGDLTELRGLL